MKSKQVKSTSPHRRSAFNIVAIGHIKRNAAKLRAFCKYEMKYLCAFGAHQADNLVKLWQEFLFVHILTTEIFCAVRRLKIKRTKEMPAKLRAFCKYAMKYLCAFGAHQADNLVKLWQEFLFVHILTTEIFCAVSRLKIKRTKEMPAKLRAFCKYAMIFSPRLSSQTLLSNS